MLTYAQFGGAGDFVGFQFPAGVKPLRYLDLTGVHGTGRAHAGQCEFGTRQVVEFGVYFPAHFHRQVDVCRELLASGHVFGFAVFEDALNGSVVSDMFERGPSHQVGVKALVQPEQLVLIPEGTAFIPPLVEQLQ